MNVLLLEIIILGERERERERVFVRLEQLSAFQKVSQIVIGLELGAPMGSNHKTEEIKLYSHKWAELC